MVLVGVVVAGLVSWLGSVAATRIGPRLGWVDRPDGSVLKVHRGTAVTLGGVAILVGVVAGWSVTGRVVWGVVGLSLAVVILGLADDRVDLSPVARLVVEAALGVGMVGSGTTPLRPTSVVELAVGVVLVVAGINAVNLFDGLDGLAGSAAGVSFLGLAALAMMRDLDPSLALLAAAAVGGFLILNRHPARVFLGDNGAYLIGLLLVVETVRVSPDGLGVQLWTAGLISGVFVVDLVFTVLRRGLAGGGLLSGDRGHLYDRLHRRFSLGAVVGMIVAAQIVFGAAALLGEVLFSGP